MKQDRKHTCALYAGSSLPDTQQPPIAGSTAIMRITRPRAGGLLAGGTSITSQIAIKDAAGHIKIGVVATLLHRGFLRHCEYGATSGRLDGREGRAG